jgi:hypothetical protein
MLYATAIETGLRAGELRALTRGRLFLDVKKPYVTCKAGTTKNKKDARQYVRPSLADDLRSLIATKSPKAKVFSMPAKDDAAAMVRADLAAARTVWVKAAVDSQERLRREQSDFLLNVNHDGEIFDFHCLRHTTGAWLAMTGVHPKVVQTVMRHSTITLTLDTYGHLFPGSESDAVSRLDSLFDGEPEAMQATGTDDAAVLPMVPVQAQRQAQQSGRERVRAGCDALQPDGGGPDSEAQKNGSPKPLLDTNLREPVRRHAKAEGKGLEPSTVYTAPDFEAAARPRIDTITVAPSRRNATSLACDLFGRPYSATRHGVPRVPGAARHHHPTNVQGRAFPRRFRGTAQQAPAKHCSFPGDARKATTCRPGCVRPESGVAQTPFLLCTPWVASSVRAVRAKRRELPGERRVGLFVSSHRGDIGLNQTVAYGNIACRYEVKSLLGPPIMRSRRSAIIDCVA